MSSVVIKFNTDNDAFQEENRNNEVYRILMELAANISSGDFDESTVIRDSNGAPIGTAEFFSFTLDDFKL